MKYFIIYNNFSGLVYNRFSENDVKKALNDAGIDFEFFVTRKSGDSIQAARDASLRVDGPIVACGGDGTVNEVLNGIIGSEKPLGIIPNGTSNLLAEELGITQNLKNICSILADRKFRRMDVGKASNRYFLMMAGIGFDAVSINKTDLVQKRFLGWGAYIFAGFPLFFNHKPFRVRIKREEMKNTMKMRARQIVVSNIKSYGTKSIQMAPHAHFDDGLFDVSIFRSRTPWDFFVHALKVVFRKEHLKDNQVTYFQAKKIVVYSRKKNKIPVHTDCEVIGHLPMEFSLLPNALSVIVP